MHIKVSDLHPTLKRALESVNYRKPDIGIEAKTTASMLYGGSDGRKGFAILVDLDRNKHEIHWGSWGGANMFNSRNPVDLDSKSYQLPPNGAIIVGSIGGQVLADITVHPSLVKLLPSDSVDLTQIEKDCLYCHRSIKGGNYRREELRRRKVDETDIENMVKRGFLKRDARGFTQITTEGKNAIEGYWG